MIVNSRIIFPKECGVAINLDNIAKCLYNYLILDEPWIHGIYLLSEGYCCILPNLPLMVLAEYIEEISVGHPWSETDISGIGRIPAQ